MIHCPILWVFFTSSRTSLDNCIRENLFFTLTEYLNICYQFEFSVELVKVVLLKRHNGYVEIDPYLLQLLCHMTSGVNFSHMFFFLFTLLFKSFIRRSKGTLTVKKILIFLEAVRHRCSSKYLFRKPAILLKRDSNASVFL